MWYSKILPVFEDENIAESLLDNSWGKGFMKVLQAISNKLQKLYLFLQTSQLVACAELVIVVFHVLC